MESLRLYILGPPRLESSPAALAPGSYINLPRRKALALLTHRVVTHESHSREGLATLFWPESDPRRSRAALRRILSDINKALGETWGIVSGDIITLNPAFEL